MSACAATTCKDAPELKLQTPPWPAAGAGVADELEKYCFPTVQDTGEQLNLCPEIDKWLQKIDKYRDQLPDKKPLNLLEKAKSMV